jgi:AGZA family xanthine/uracil permease-like MFS transporter
MTAEPFRYRWAARGDINGFFALSIDNLALLVSMSGILIGVFGMPVDIVLGRMVPGTAVGVLIGDAIYTWLAFRLAKKERRQDVCAMPLGIDTPSMFALSFGVVGPAFVITKDGMKAWEVGMAVLVLMGVAKLIASFFGEYIRRILPKTALLGAISAVGVALIMFFPFAKIMAEPIGGFVALGVVLLTLIGRVRLPANIPAVVASVLAGLAAYSVARAFGYAPPTLPVTGGSFGLHLPWPSTAFVEGLDLAWQFIPLAVPAAFLTVVGGIDVTESASLAGDRYSTRTVLLVEGIATLGAALCGGVVQNTPYIGHPAYKRMGSRAAYTLATGLFISIGAATGLIGVLISALPESVVVPILVYVGLEMSAQAVHESEPKHVQAIALALIPVIANLVNIQMGGVLGAARVDVTTLPPDTQRNLTVLTMLGNGFIVTAMIWATWLVWIIDRRMIAAAWLCVVAAALTAVGLIHSPYPDARLFIPDASTPRLVFALVVGYLLLGGMCAALSRSPIRVAEGAH